MKTLQISSVVLTFKKTLYISNVVLNFEKLFVEVVRKKKNEVEKALGQFNINMCRNRSESIGRGLRWRKRGRD